MIERVTMYTNFVNVAPSNQVRILIEINFSPVKVISL